VTAKIRTDPFIFLYFPWFGIESAYNGGYCSVVNR